MKLPAIAFVLISGFSHAQAPDSSSQQVEYKPPAYILKLYNNRNGKSFTLHEGKHVKTYFEKGNGKFKYKKGTLTSISRYKLLFTPENEKYKPIEYDVDPNEGFEPLEKISFTSNSSIVKGTVFHLMLGGVFYLITVSPGVAFGTLIVVGILTTPIFGTHDVMELYMMSQKNPKKYPYPGSFRKHIDLRTNRWRMEVVRESQPVI